jgi:nucleoid DNA-binding protein
MCSPALARTQAQLVDDLVAKGHNLESATAFVRDVEVAINAEINSGARVVLKGFGSFHAGKLSDKSCRNPRTGAPMSCVSQSKINAWQQSETYGTELLRKYALSPEIYKDWINVQIAAVCAENVENRGFGTIQKVLVREHYKTIKGKSVFVPAYQKAVFKKAQGSTVEFRAGKELNDAVKNCR